MFSVIQYETNVTPKVQPQPDSGIVFDDIVGDISELSSSRPPPVQDRPTNHRIFQIQNRQYDGIKFTQGKNTVQTCISEATVQLTPKGPVERIGKTIPYVYDDAAMNTNRRKDFQGIPMPLRDPDKEFEGPTRFPSQRPGDRLAQTHSTYGQEIQHESHRFGLTNAFWPIENRDSKLHDFQPPVSQRNVREVSRIYADPRQADLAYKLENKRSQSDVFRSTDHRRMKLLRTSKGRKAIQGTYQYVIF